MLSLSLSLSLDNPSALLLAAPARCLTVKLKGCKANAHLPIYMTIFHVGHMNEWVVVSLHIKFCSIQVSPEMMNSTDYG